MIFVISVIQKENKMNNIKKWYYIFKKDNQYAVAEYWGEEFRRYSDWFDKIHVAFNCMFKKPKEDTKLLGEYEIYDILQSRGLTGFYQSILSTKNYKDKDLESMV